VVCKECIETGEKILNRDVGLLFFYDWLVLIFCHLKLYLNILKILFKPIDRVIPSSSLILLFSSSK
jgi:hypothetical protein